MREAEKVERFRFAFPSRLPIARCLLAKLEQASLLVMQFQLELSQSLTQFSLKPLGLVLMLKAHNKVSLRSAR